MEAIDEEQSAWILQHARERDARFYVPILAAITTGLRRGELLALKWSDFALDIGVLEVRRSLEQTKVGGLRFKETKGKKARRIDVPPLLREALIEHRIRQAEFQKQFANEYQSHDLVFPQPDGSLWPPDSFTSGYLNLIESAGLRRIRFHDLRHSHASQMLRHGVHPKVVQERLGHSSIAVTMDIYSHLLPGVQQEAVKKVDESLRRAIRQKQAAQIH
jgi:integrase